MEIAPHIVIMYSRPKFWRSVALYSLPQVWDASAWTLDNCRSEAEKHNHPAVGDTYSWRELFPGSSMHEPFLRIGTYCIFTYKQTFAATHEDPTNMYIIPIHHTHTHTHTHKRTHTRTYMILQRKIRTYTHTHTHTHACMHTWNTYVHTHTQTRTYVILQRKIRAHMVPVRCALTVDSSE
jgi:hypothetical protein